MTLAEVLDRCIDQWTAQGIAVAPPISEHEVHRVWSRFGSKPSADVIELYTSVGGFQDYVFDEGLTFSFWPWDWLKKRNAENPGLGVMFGDHSIEVVTWEIRYDNPQTSSVWSSHGNTTAPTLKAFFSLYLEDPWQLV